MTSPIDRFPQSQGNDHLPERVERMYLRYAPGALARFYASNRASYSALNDVKLQQRWRALPLTGAFAEAWFPIVFPGQLLPGHMVRVWVGPRVGDALPVPQRHATAAIEWVKRVLGSDSRLLPLEPELEFWMDLAPETPLDNLASSELACACALISWLTQRVPSVAVVASGTVRKTVRPWAVGPVGEIAAKHAIVESERTAADVGFEAMLVGDQRLDTVLAWLEKVYGPELSRSLSHACARDPATMVQQAVRLWERNKPSARALAEAALAAPELAGNSRAVAEWLVGTQAMHEGDSTAALTWIERAKNSWDDSDDVRFPRTHMRAWLASLSAIAQVDNGLVTDALDELQHTHASLQKMREPTHDWEVTATHVAGSLRRLMQAAGRLDDAIAFYGPWIVRITPPHEHARCLHDLALMHWNNGDRDQARAALERASSALPLSLDEARPSNRRYQEMLAMRMGLVTPPPKPSRWAVGPRLLVAPFLQTVIHYQWADDYQPMIEGLMRFEGPDVEGRSLALRFVVLRGLAEHWLVKEVAGTAAQGLLVAKFIADTRTMLDPHQAPALIEALHELEAGEPRPWLRVSPY